MTTLLIPQYDSRASFYGKARITEIVSNGATGNHKLIVLTSYSTDVASITELEGDKQAIVNGTYSQTTLRHIKEFLRQNGFNATSKAQIEKDYIHNN